MTVRERPILLSAPLVRAILEGRKTQTRRVIKPQPEVTEQRLRELGAWIEGESLSEQVNAAWQHGFIDVNCPYGQPSDRLWVRETWEDYGHPIRDESSRCPRNISYRADSDFKHPAPLKRWRPSIHMPRWAARILLEITDVRVERLQDITGNDVEAEGCDFPDAAGIDSLAARWEPFRALWESINGPGSWGANPWVWAITFRRVEA